MRYWTAYGLLTVSFAAAVVLRGGVYPRQWQWLAAAISVGALLCVAGKSAPKDRWTSAGFGLLGALLAWMGVAMLPLPPALVEFLSPARWADVAAARAAAGVDPHAWTAMSYAPSATLERLLDVLPAIAVFLAARELGWRWRGRAWIVPAPVILVAWMESLLGLAQFALARLAGGEAAPAAGTYVNRNHFAGLLELALPLAAMGALELWRKNADRVQQSMAAAVRVAVVAGIAVCLLGGIVVSLSRMGFFAAVASLALASALLLIPQGRHFWRWTPVLAIPVALLLLLPTSELRERLSNTVSTSELSAGTRLEIWRDTLHFISGHAWTGTGLGAYERGLYRYKTVKPVNTLDFAHNDYLQAVAELGIPGALLLAAIAVWTVRRPLRLALSRRNSRHRELSIGLLGAFCAIGLHGLTDFNLYIPANALAFAWLAGLAVSPGLREASTASESARRSAYAERGWPTELPQAATTNLR